MEAIILAGGFGTRLRDIISDLPKPMAPISGRPFLAILLDELSAAGFTTVTLAVGYRHAAIREYFGERYGSLRLNYSIESDPLGTGGAIRLALNRTLAPRLFVLNGDTHLELDYRAMFAVHLKTVVSLTIAILTVPDTSRYGALKIEQGSIHGFFEKGRYGPGEINGGVYLMSRDLFDRHTLPTTFSFESDFLMPNIQTLRPQAFQVTGTFIDIGVPEDYVRAQKILGHRVNP